MHAVWKHGMVHGWGAEQHASVTFFHRLCAPLTASRFTMFPLPELLCGLLMQRAQQQLMQRAQLLHPKALRLRRPGQLGQMFLLLHLFLAGLSHQLRVAMVLTSLGTLQPRHHRHSLLVWPRMKDPN